MTCGNSTSRNNIEKRTSCWVSSSLSSDMCLDRKTSSTTGTKAGIPEKIFYFLKELLARNKSSICIKINTTITKLTVSLNRLIASHQSVTKLKNFWNFHNRFRVLLAVGQQYQKLKNVWKQNFNSTKTKSFYSNNLLNALQHTD